MFRYKSDKTNEVSFCAELQESPWTAFVYAELQENPLDSNNNPNPPVTVPRSLKILCFRNLSTLASERTAEQWCVIAIGASPVWTVKNVP
jgi:hypothetical protein